METWQIIVLALLALLLVVSVFNIVRILLAMRKPVPTTYAPAPVADEPVADQRVADERRDEKAFDDEPIAVTTTESSVFARPADNVDDEVPAESVDTTGTEAEHAVDDEPVIEDSGARPSRAAD